MTAPSTAAGIDWEGDDWAIFRSVSDALQAADPLHRVPYWRCQTCLGPALPGQWNHSGCIPIVALAQVLAASREVTP